ncbi:MAG: MarR family winged helix-turn-helix transcriptional regulator [Betaproteobacteria bacterium]
MPLSKAQAITRTILQCCSHLDDLKDAVHQSTGITSGMRTVLEALYERGVLTVPQIARSRGVTRQHIQALTDRLLASELVTSHENPRDRRSPLLRLTEKGTTLFETVREHEAQVLSGMSRALSAYDVDVALSALGALESHLAQERARVGNHSGRNR